MLKQLGKFLMIVFGAIFALLLISLVYHRFMLSREKDKLQPLGKIVDLPQGRMSIYDSGPAEGQDTLIFLPGGGTCSPILDFRSLTNLLEGDFRVVVIEKFGYGFSDDVSGPRDNGHLLEEVRSALADLGIRGPYVVCPHSMSGILSLYWAQKHPEEIKAIIGLDMALPVHYEKMEFNPVLLKLGQFVASTGIFRFLPVASESEAIKYGKLTDEEKEIYKAIFYSRTANQTMLNEVDAIKENAKEVSQGPWPDIPILLLLSDGSGGTGFSKEDWRNLTLSGLPESDKIRIVSFDAPHYIHNHEYENINELIRAFLQH